SPGVTRTPDQRFRKPLLYPSELRGHAAKTLLSISLPQAHPCECRVGLLSPSPAVFLSSGSNPQISWSCAFDPSSRLTASYKCFLWFRVRIAPFQCYSFRPPRGDAAIPVFTKGVSDRRNNGQQTSLGFSSCSLRDLLSAGDFDNRRPRSEHVHRHL